MDKLWALLRKYREVVLYLFFGGLTTLVNIAAYALFARALAMDVTLSTVVAWVFSVVFAYLTNRKWVFQSRASGSRAVLCEIGAFFGGRAFSGLLDVGIMFLFAQTLGFNDMIVKILSNVLVIVLNYILSKWIVFRKPKDGAAHGRKDS